MFCVQLIRPLVRNYRAIVGVANESFDLREDVYGIYTQMGVCFQLWLKFRTRTSSYRVHKLLPVSLVCFYNNTDAIFRILYLPVDFSYEI